VASIQSGPARVADSGVVTAFMGFPLRIQTPIEGYQFGVELRFRTDASVEEVHVGSEFIDGTLILDLVNFDTDTGRGSSRPVLIGQTDTEAVFFHFKVFRYGATDDHTVHYTFYAASKEAIGFQPTP
jgi:hypothetical protein